MARLHRVRTHALFWPLLAYVVWTVVVLALQPAFYAETPSNLWHGARIVLTLAMALALTREEVLWAVRGFALAVVTSVLLIAVHKTIGLPDFSLWRNLLQYTGNKSISNAVLLSVVAGSALVVALAHAGKPRAIGIAVALAALMLILNVLPNRTSILIIFGALLAGAVHQWRRYRLRLLLFLSVALLAGLTLIVAVPPVQTRLAQGVDEMRQSLAGQITQDSWNQRVQMVRHTSRMIADRPWMGWGIGGWNDQWRKRAPPLIADLNMPHNDLLWMGAQAGVPGALSWLAIMLAACRAGWRRRDMLGRLAFVAALTLLFTALVNSATRDAVIGLSLLWIIGLYLRLAAEPAGMALDGLLPPTWLGTRPADHVAPSR